VESRGSKSDLERGGKEDSEEKRKTTILQGRNTLSEDTRVSTLLNRGSGKEKPMMLFGPLIHARGGRGLMGKN